MSLEERWNALDRGKERIGMTQGSEAVLAALHVHKHITVEASYQKSYWSFMSLFD